MLRTIHPIPQVHRRPLLEAATSATSGLRQLCLGAMALLFLMSCSGSALRENDPNSVRVVFSHADDPDRTDAHVIAVHLPELLHLGTDVTGPHPRIYAYLPEGSDLAGLEPVLVPPRGVRLERLPAQPHAAPGDFAFALHPRSGTAQRLDLTLITLRLIPGLNFDGQTSAVTVPAGLPIDGRSPFTLETWIKVNSLPTADDWTKAPVALNLFGDAFLRLTLADGCSTPDRIGVRAQLTESGWCTPVESGRLVTDRWYHIAVTFDPSEGWILYQDGQAVSRSALTETIVPSTGASHLGADPHRRRSKHLDGSLREVRIWNTARNQAEIQYAMHRQVSGDEAGLLACWPLNDGEGTRARDLGPRELHGRIWVPTWTPNDIEVINVDGSPSADGLRSLLPSLSDDGHRVAVVNRLALIGGDLATSSLLDVLAQDPSPQVRMAACVGLLEQIEPRVLEAMIAALDDPDPRISSAALVGVQRHGDAAHPVLMEAIAGAVSTAGRVLVIDELRRQVVTDAMPALRTAIADPTVAVRIAAGQALGVIGAGRPDAATVQVLMGALADSQPKVRDAAALALGQMGGAEARRILLASPYADWPMWGRDSGRSGISPLALLLEGAVHLQWHRHLGSPRRAWRPQLDDGDKLEFDRYYAPVVADGRVFVASMNNDSLSAYDLDSGAKLWRFYADGPMRLAPAVWQDRVIAVSDDGHCYALDAASGTLIWRHTARPTAHRVLGNERVISMWPARGAPVVVDDRVYYAAGVWPFLGTFLFALDVQDGSEIWANTGHAFAWNRQPHGGAYSFAGLAPQGYIAVADDRLVVSGGRALPGLFDRREGHLLHYEGDGRDGGGKRVGGYRVRVHEGLYYNHGRLYLLASGDSAGFGILEHQAVDALQAAVAAVADQLDAPPVEALVAGERLLVVSEAGTLSVFGPQAVASVEYPAVKSPAAPPQDTVASVADAILAHGSSGYALVLGLGDGDLLEALALRSDLHLIGIDADQKRIDDLRRRYDAAGLYGERIALLCDDPLTAHFPAYISSLIVMTDAAGFGAALGEHVQDGIYRRLRPYTGSAVILGATPEQRAALSTFEAVNGQVEIAADGAIHVQRTGPLPDSGQWTHQHADAAQTAMSQDALVRPPLAPTWFGGPTNDHVLPRHTTGPRPQVAGGRVVLLGVETLSARCAFTGRELWLREFPGIGHPFTDLALEELWRAGEEVYMTNIPGATYIGSPVVTLPDAVYLRYRGRIHRLDPDSGETLALFDLPAREPAGASDWGHLSVIGEVLLTTSDPHIFDAGLLGQHPANWDGTSSERLIALDRHEGRVLWQRDAAIGFRHNAIAGSGDRVFVIDSLSEQARQHDARRGRASAPARIMALDLHSGAKLWSNQSEVFGTYLSYSQTQDIVLEGGTTDGRRHLPDEPTERMIARRGSDGSIVWDRPAGRGPRILRGDELIPSIVRSGESPTIDLLTGKPYLRRNPLHGEQEPWSYWRTYGCGASNASTHLLLFRSGAAGFTDLSGDSGTGTFGGFKSGCTSNMIAADGLLIAPDYTRTCTCSYQNQTSIGMIHMPEMEIWTANHARRNPPETLRRAGINLGAPGDRRSADGILWSHFPRQAPTVEFDMVTEPAAPAAFHRFSLFLDNGSGLPWVAASGLRDLRSLTLRGINGENRPYRVVLHFSEPEDVGPGQRRFDIRINGTVLARDYDIAQATGGRDRATTLVFEQVAIAADLLVELLPSSDSAFPPLLSGISIDDNSAPEAQP